MSNKLRRTGAIAHSTVEHSSSPIENILQTGLWITVYWINHFLALLRWSVWIQYTTPSSNCRGNKESKRSSRISSWGKPGWKSWIRSYWSHIRCSSESGNLVGFRIIECLLLTRKTIKSVRSVLYFGRRLKAYSIPLAPLFTKPYARSPE